MGKRWTIENVPEETINAIKQRAVDYCIPIAQVLAEEFGGKEKVYKKDSWTIWNMPQDLRNDIVRLAKKSNKAVPDFLRVLMGNKDQAKMEKEVKEQLLNAVQKCLKDFKKE